MLKNILKKSASALLVLGIAGNTIVFAEGNSIFIGSGNIEISESYGNKMADKKVTISVTDEDYNYTDESVWSNPNNSRVKYFGNGVTDSDGNVTFNFNLSANGLYNVYIACEGEDNLKQYTIEYTNKSGNETAVTSFNSYCRSGDTDSLESLIKNGRYDLRLYTDLYTKADLRKTAELVIANRIGNSQDLSSDEVKVLLEKALCVNCLNSKKIADIAGYEDTIGMSADAKKYYKASNSKTITAMLQKSEIPSITEYESRLTDAILTTAINTNDGTEIIEDILNDFKTKYNISKTITNSLCSAIAGKGGFENFSAVLSFISTYVEPVIPQSPSTSSPSGNGTAGIISPPSSQQTNQNTEVEIFKDLPKGHWAAEAVKSLYYKNIVSGKSEDEFCPNDNVKREEFVKMLVEAFRFDLVNDGFELDDVKKSDWYYDAVKTAYAAEIVTGVSDNLFGAGNFITRQDMSVMIKNALDISDVTLEAKVEKVDFTDNDKFADYAKSAVEYLQTAQIISGYPDGTFNPTGNATRAEAAGIIYRLLDYIK